MTASQNEVAVGGVHLKRIFYFLLFGAAIILSLSFMLIQTGMVPHSSYHECPNVPLREKESSNETGKGLEGSEIISVQSELVSVQELVEGLAQDDERLLNYIRRKHLTPPSTLPYNLENPGKDPGDHFGQNKIVMEILGNGNGTMMRGGFFVDSGAHNGEHLSNTLIFEKDYGWSGLLVEPSPIELPNLRSKNRKAWIADVCVAPSTQPSTFEYLHRVNYTIASKLESANTANPKNNDDPDLWKSYKLPCFPIFSLLAAINVKVVDYWSLDVEGVEIKVLKTVPFESILIKVISVEFFLLPEGADALVEFMISKNYTVVQKMTQDYIFAHNSLNYQNKTVNASSTEDKKIRISSRKSNGKMSID